MVMNTVTQQNHVTIDDVPALSGRDILCFSHDWTGDPLSKTHLMRLLSRHNRVLWVNSIGYRTPSVASRADMSRAVKKLLSVALPIREPEPNLFVLNPLAVPFYGLRRQAGQRASAPVSDSSSHAETRIQKRDQLGVQPRSRSHSPETG